MSLEVDVEGRDERQPDNKSRNIIQPKKAVMRSLVYLFTALLFHLVIFIGLEGKKVYLLIPYLSRYLTWH